MNKPAAYTARAEIVLKDGAPDFSIYSFSPSRAPLTLEGWQKKNEEIAPQVAAALNPMREIFTISYVEPECGGAFTVIGNAEEVRKAMLNSHECWLSEHENDFDDEEALEGARMADDWALPEILDYMRGSNWTVDLNRHQIDVSTLAPVQA